MLNSVCELIYKLIRKIKSLFYTFIFKNMTGNCNSTGLKIDGFVDYRVRKIKIGKNVRIYNNVVFAGTGEIVIGDNVQIGNNVIIFASEEGGVSIGNDVSIAANCYIIDTNHGTSSNEKINLQANLSEKIEIGNDVWIAASTMVVKGAKIPDGVVVGANSVVNKELESYGIYVGSPVKKIKDRQ